MKKTVGVFLIIVFSASLSATKESSILIQRQDIERDLQLSALQLKKLNSELEELVLALHKIDNTQTNWLFFWQNFSKKKKERDRLRKILSMSVNDKLSLIRKKKKQEEELQAELELLIVKNKYNFKTTNNRELKFVCENFPLKIEKANAVELKQSFGVRQDLETGVSWTSQGWWIDYTQGKQVRNCAPGKIVFNSYIKGRGRVVIVEHEKGVISVYGNLSGGKEKSLEVGRSIKKNVLLGTALERFYFELRANGLALNPRYAFDRKTLTEIGGL